MNREVFLTLLAKAGDDAFLRNADLIGDPPDNTTDEASGERGRWRAAVHTGAAVVLDELKVRFSKVRPDLEEVKTPDCFHRLVNKQIDRIRDWLAEVAVQVCPDCGERPSVNGGRCGRCRGESML